MSEIEKFFIKNKPNSQVVKRKVIQFGIDFLGGEWKNTKEEDVNVSENMGGQSNYLYHVTSFTFATPFLLRIHRQTPDMVFMDTIIFAHLSERGLGPKLYGFFEGGRLEEFLECKYFQKADSRVPDFLR